MKERIEKLERNQRKLLARVEHLEEMTGFTLLNIMTAKEREEYKIESNT